ncbi:GNAT family N-acetyltransferase [Halobacteriaceae archaeon GCM10025711]
MVGVTTLSPSQRGAYEPASCLRGPLVDTPSARKPRRSRRGGCHDLSPREIDAVVDATFDDDAVQAKLDAADVSVLLAERDDAVVGFAETVTAAEDALRWLHVHPEHRGRDVGTTLFERAISELREQGSERAPVAVVAADAQGTEFVERFGFEKTDERETTIGDRTFIEHVYAGETAESTAELSASESSTGRTGGDATGDEQFPDTATADGAAVFLGDDYLPGVEGPFAPTYTDADRTEQYGYYCGNCGSTHVSVDSMERVKCSDCGNVNKPDENYDGSYL